MRRLMLLVLPFHGLLAPLEFELLELLDRSSKHVQSEEQAGKSDE